MIYVSHIEYALNKFLTGICVVCSIRKIVCFTQKSLIPLRSLCKLYHETDCHRFNEYKQSHCGITLGPQSNSRYRKNIPWAFFHEHTYPLIETSSRGSCNSQELDLDKYFYF